MFSRMTVLLVAVVVCISTAMGDDFFVGLSNFTVPLMTTCDGTTPAPDGTIVYVYWDANANGPDPSDALAPLCSDPPFCYNSQPWVNFNQFSITADYFGLMPGTFASTVYLVSHGTFAVPRFYLRVPVAGGEWVSEVATFIVGPQEVDYHLWTCTDNSAPCPQTPDLVFLAAPPQPDSVHISMCPGHTLQVRVGPLSCADRATQRRPYHLRYQALSAGDCPASSEIVQGPWIRQAVGFDYYDCTTFTLSESGTTGCGVLLFEATAAPAYEATELYVEWAETRSACVQVTSATDAVIVTSAGSSHGMVSVTVQPGCNATTHCEGNYPPPAAPVTITGPVHCGDSLASSAARAYGLSVGEQEGGWYCVTVDWVLPVEFGTLDLTAQDGAVSVAWNTRSETQVDHFELWRDGVHVHSVAATNTTTGQQYRYEDSSLSNGQTYRYELFIVNTDGARQSLALASATPSVEHALITEYALHQNYPNPFNPTTSIAVDLVESGFVSLKVYNLIGEEVADLSGGMTAGRHIVKFNASNLSSGIYLCRLSVNGFAAEKKMLLMK